MDNEQPTKYWMWSKRKHSGRPLVQSLTPSSTINDSWEEQAFAEDSAGPLGGCIWPPRSYSCSFCRREFRSAQALGGHMNVHRRDRARLKQSPSPLNENLQQQQQQQQHHQSPYTALGVQYSSQVCTLVYNNPNPIAVASPISPSRVSAPSTQENCSEQTLVSPSYDSPIVKEQQKGFFFSPHLSLSNSLSVRVRNVSDSNLERENSRVKDSGCRGRVDRVKVDSDVGSLNFILRRSRSQSIESDGDEDEGISVKRRRIGGASLSMYTRPSTGDRLHLQTEVLGLGPSPVEELDLELRLGDRPKVK